MSATLKRRLQRLEKATTPKQALYQPRNPFKDIDEYDAWMSGEGPRPPNPPCPPWISLENWAQRLRMGHVLGLCAPGEISSNYPTPEYSQFEIAEAEYINKTCDEVAEIKRKQEEQEDTELQTGLAILEQGRMKLDK
jgi:hypothetical protein